jgi:hypothetical protein
VKWAKRGLVFAPDGSSSWARHTALQPTPLLLPGGDRIRVYTGCRDDAGVSRVGFVEVDAGDPGKVLDVAQGPAFDVGSPGAFDDNGVVPCAVVPREDGRIFLYYAGYSIPSQVKFHVFGGLATSDDGGLTFTRASRAPVLDRTDDELLFRVAHTVRQEHGTWRVWYGGGSSWVHAEGKTLPVYDVRYLESPDGITFPNRGATHVAFANDDEYRIGRPFVFREEPGPYRMFYGVATLSAGYRLGYAESSDGHQWTRRDDDVGLDVSPDDWDSDMVAYPSVVTAGEHTWMFYNGNNMGRGGFGYAELISW